MHQVNLVNTWYIFACFVVVCILAEFCNIWFSRDIFWHSGSGAHALHCSRTCDWTGKTLQVKGFNFLFASVFWH